MFFGGEVWMIGLVDWEISRLGDWQIADLEISRLTASVLRAHLVADFVNTLLAQNPCIGCYKKEGVWYLTAPEVVCGSGFYPYLVPAGTVGSLEEFRVT